MSANSLNQTKGQFSITTSNTTIKYKHIQRNTQETPLLVPLYFFNTAIDCFHPPYLL